MTTAQPNHRRPSISRRATLAGVAAAGLSGLALAGLVASGAIAQRADGPAQIAVEELAKSGADLPELSIGSPDAKVVIVEYASLTCGHCAHFHNTVEPELKTKYLDTGKARLIFRPFPLNNIDAAAFMLTRCVAPDKTLPLIDTFFKTQADWAFKEGNPVPRLFEIGKQVGFTQETFDKCLTDQALLDKLTAVRTRASEKFGVHATPTFFINGKKLQSAPSIGEFDKMIEPLLPKG